MMRRERYQVDARPRAPEEPQVVAEDFAALSLDPRYTALPMEQGGSILDEESTDDPVDLGTQLLLQAMESERIAANEAATPEQLVCLLDETLIDESEIA